MDCIQVKLKARASEKPSGYEVWIGAGVIQKIPHCLPLFLQERVLKRAFLIHDRNLTQEAQVIVPLLVSDGWHVEVMAVIGGERLKSMQAVMPLYGELLKRKADRHSVLFALGGGSVGDVVGFIASTYMRGLSWVGLPTTLLAQVDSSIGGKTAINHSMAKNLIGTIYPPSLVMCDSHFLKTLSKRELISGMGEMIKYGMLYDADDLNFLKNSLSPAMLLGHKTEALLALLIEAIPRALYWKARVVAQDEFDHKGIREFLNFGHTFGHALEKITHFKRYRHGEAVIWGMRFALALSEVRKKLNSKTRQSLDLFLSTLRVPPFPSSLLAQDLFLCMQNDKKNQGGQVRFVLLSHIGKPIADDRVSNRDLRAAFKLMMDSNVG